MADHPDRGGPSGRAGGAAAGPGQGRLRLARDPIRNAAWLRPWEPTNPETPLYRSSLGPYIAMARTMRKEARQGLTLPWVVTYGGPVRRAADRGQHRLGIGAPAQVGYWIDEAYAGRRA